MQTNDSASNSTPRSVLLRGANIVLTNEIRTRGSLLIKDGRISALLSSVEDHDAQADTILDLSGLTLLPGFIDIHIHGAIGVDTMAAGAEDLKRVSQFLASRGVTGWLPTLVPASTSDYERSTRAIEDAMKSDSGARILGLHYEGPFVNSAECGALRARFFRAFSGAQDIDDLTVIDSKAAKHMMTVAPEIEGGLELIRELDRRGWIVSIGHTRAGFELLNKAFLAGAHHMTHFMNAMAPLHHRSPGPVAWGLSRDDVTCDVIADGIHLNVHMLELLVKLKGVDCLTLISDAVAAAGLGDGNYKIWGETIGVQNGRTRNSQGNLAGSVITLHEAIRTMQSLGISEIDLAQMASTNPARLLGIDQDCGAIEEGKRADLVALDQKGNVRLTIVGGQPQNTL
jgi:N-acetylglucosamine-6-phosphate deacetylase